MNYSSLNSRLFTIIFVIIIFLSSCADSRKIAYFNDVQDSALIASRAGIEPIIQNKDILSIAVSSYSPDAASLFNSPNETGAASPQTAGYLVSQNGTIKFPLLGDLQAKGLTQKELENNIYKLLVDKKLLFDPIVTVRLLNFKVTVLGEVNQPGVVSAPNGQINILEAIGQAGDLTIFGLRDNVILIRQEDENKLVKRLNLNSSDLLKSPYFFLKSNDVIYVEPGKAKVASATQGRQILPIVLSTLSVVTVILTRFIK